jgi:hypothetical protein
MRAKELSKWIVVTLTGPIIGEKLVLDFNRIKRAKKQ